MQKESKWYSLFLLLTIIVFREGDELLLLLVLLSLAGHGDSYWSV
jgi:high-affinity Fe2+/Pb2+ permease